MNKRSSTIPAITSVNKHQNWKYKGAWERKKKEEARYKQGEGSNRIIRQARGSQCIDKPG
jgi:hypothetical protein